MMGTVSNERIVAALLTSKTMQEAAESCGLTERAIRKRMETPEFRMLYADAKTAILERATTSIQGHTSAAVDTMAEVMKDTKNAPQVRLNAADAVLRNALKLTEQQDILERLSALERAQHG